jgi:hypothetical protein
MLFAIAQSIPYPDHNFKIFLNQIWISLFEADFGAKLILAIYTPQNN